MYLNSRGKWLVAALACATAQWAWAVSATPASVTLAAGASQTVQLNKVRGTLTVSNSRPAVASVARINATTYRISALTGGTAALQFKDRNSTANVSVTVNSATPEALAGRLLASNCFQCHGTNGSGGFEKLAGKSANSIYEKLREFAIGKEDSNGIMAAHAMGFTDGQLRSISTYFASQR